MISKCEKSQRTDTSITNTPSSGESSTTNNVTSSNITTTKKPKISPYKKDTRKLFVGGLSNKANDDNFRAFFNKFGRVIDSVVMIDRQTKRKRGFGFVSFERAEDAMKVLACGNEGQPVPSKGFRSGKIEIFGKMCEVKMSEPKKGRSETTSGEWLATSSNVPSSDPVDPTPSSIEGLSDKMSVSYGSPRDAERGITNPNGNAVPMTNFGITDPYYDSHYTYMQTTNPCHFGNAAAFCQPLVHNPGMYYNYNYMYEYSPYGDPPTLPVYSSQPVYMNPHPIPSSIAIANNDRTQQWDIIEKHEN